MCELPEIYAGDAEIYSYSFENEVLNIRLIFFPKTNDHWNEVEMHICVDFSSISGNVGISNQLDPAEIDWGVSWITWRTVMQPY